ncbi:hypothetical protein L596_009642 [Steinernema carpocapsae]|nr:hypothetical protein L596_009642 [Steinernema carpocapsae]
MDRTRDDATNAILKLLLWHSADGIPTHLLLEDYKHQTGAKVFPSEAFGCDCFEESLLSMGFVEFGENNFIRGNFHPSDFTEPGEISSNESSVTDEMLQSCLRAPATIAQLCGRLKERYNLSITDETVGQLFNCPASCINDVVPYLEGYGIHETMGKSGTYLTYRTENNKKSRSRWDSANETACQEPEQPQKNWILDVDFSRPPPSLYQPDNQEMEQFYVPQLQQEYQHGFQLQNSFQQQEAEATNGNGTPGMTPKQLMDFMNTPDPSFQQCEQMPQHQWIQDVEFSNPPPPLNQPQNPVFAYPEAPAFQKTEQEAPKKPMEPMFPPFKPQLEKLSRPTPVFQANRARSKRPPLQETSMKPNPAETVAVFHRRTLLPSPTVQESQHDVDKKTPLVNKMTYVQPSPSTVSQMRAPSTVSQVRAPPPAVQELMQRKPAEVAYVQPVSQPLHEKTEPVFASRHLPTPHEPPMKRQKFSKAPSAVQSLVSRETAPGTLSKTSNPASSGVADGYLTLKIMVQSELLSMLPRMLNMCVNDPDGYADLMSTLQKHVMRYAR